MQKLEALPFLVCLRYPYGTCLIFRKSFGLCSGFICSCIRISAVWRKVNVKSFHVGCFSLEEKIMHASCFLQTLSLHFFAVHTFVCHTLFFLCRLFIMLRRFPIESKGRRKKLYEVCVYLSIEWKVIRLDEFTWSGIFYTRKAFRVHSGISTYTGFFFAHVNAQAQNFINNEILRSFYIHDGGLVELVYEF